MLSAVSSDFIIAGSRDSSSGSSGDVDTKRGVGTKERTKRQKPGVQRGRREGRKRESERAKRGGKRILLALTWRPLTSTRLPRRFSYVFIRLEN